MAKENKSGTVSKHVYEAPKAIKLDGTSNSIGDCTTPGSNADSPCMTGNFATLSCTGDGNSPGTDMHDCFSSGNSASTACVSEGNGF